MASMIIPAQAWVAVCDGARAILLQNHGNAEHLDLRVFDALDEPHPAAHDLGSDRPGRVYQSHGGARSATEETDRHVRAEADFLSGIARRLDGIVREHGANHLTVVAPPRALGILREHYSADVRAALKAEIGKDLAGLPVADIERHLRA